jgi:molecular chaperone DnaK (HSP70)
MDRPYRVVAAIDFGTHGTGFAWAAVSEDNDDPGRRRIAFFEDWERQNLAYPKNRSAILLDASGQFMSWGYEAVAQLTKAPPGSRWKMRTGFKMALQSGPRDPDDTGGGQAGVIMSDGEPDAYRLTVMCLRQVIARARDRITSGAYEEADIRWCVTVPAIWDQYTQELMFKAAVEAGLPDAPGRLVLAQESAAAALYCKAKGDSVLSTPGTRFLVVDAGGGTVDVSCYQVDDDGSLSELASAAGTETGSEFLNRAFLNDILTERFEAGVVARILAERRSAVADTMDSWERAKRSFSPDSKDDVIIHLSASFYAGLVKEKAEGRWAGEPVPEITVSHAAVAALFDRRIDETMACVEQQLDRMRTASGTSGGEVALLVGGFAESPYLQARLASRLTERDVRLVVPAQPSVAVMAGGIHFAYGKQEIVSWRAPSTLGIQAALPFRPGIDPESRRRVNAVGEERCSGRFDIYYASQTPVTAGEPITRIYWPLREQQRVIKLDLLSTDHVDVQYVTDPEVEKLATLTVDLSALLDLPIAERRVEVAMYLDQSRVRVEARHAQTGEPQAIDIEWQQDW